MAGIEALHAAVDQGRELARNRFLSGILHHVRYEVCKSCGAVLAESTVERERILTTTAEEIPVAIPREVNGDAVQPRGERRIATKVGESAVSADKSVLGDFF